MDINVTFKPSDFKTFRTFENAMNKQLGSKAYVGSDSCTVVFAYPKELIRLIRPLEDCPDDLKPKIKDLLKQEQFELNLTSI